MQQMVRVVRFSWLSAGQLSVKTRRKFKIKNVYYVHNRLKVSSLEKCGFELTLTLLSVNFVSQNKNIVLSIPGGGCGGGGGGWIMDIYLWIATSIVVLWVIKQIVDGNKVSEKCNASSSG
jgi:hypothetical protein